MSKRNVQRWARRQYQPGQKDYPTWQRWLAAGIVAFIALAILKLLGVL